MSDQAVGYIYILSAALFIMSLKWMSTPTDRAARGDRGRDRHAAGVVGTLLRHEIVDYKLILAALFLGSAVGVPIAYLMPMTAVPQRTALSHAFGALAAALVGTAEYYRATPHGAVMVPLVFETLLGYLTFTG